MNVTKLTKQDLTDILYGATIFGTGGGGELDEGFEYIDKAIEEGKSFKLVSIDDVPDEAKICTPYMLGAISPMSADQEKQYKGLARATKTSIDIAFQRLEEYTGDKYFGTICCELGGSNTAISFYVAAMNDGYIIDADPAGRAVPEITHSTYYFNDLPAAPIVTANEFGECFICENVQDDSRAESIVRALAKVSRNDIAAIDHALPAKQLKNAVIKNTISKSLEMGRAYRIAVQQGDDLAEVIANKGGGVVRFIGNTTQFSFGVEEGFTVGSFSIKGKGKYEGQTYLIEVKNENLVAYLNDEVDVTIPDLICCIDIDSGEPVTNPNHIIGMNIATVILPAPKEFTTKRGLAAFGPSYINLNQAYKPAIKAG